MVNQLFQDALDGKRGDDQQRIAEEVIRWGELLLRKNHDYGSSAWRSPMLHPKLKPGDAILVRMSDKLERIKSLMVKGTPEVDEAIEDTIQDLGAYCLLWAARPKD